MRNAAQVAVVTLLAVACAVPVHAQAVEDQYFDSDGVKIHYIVQGEGEPVVLIHGFCANLDMMWLLPGVVDAMAKEYTVIALDCRGHGKSGKPHDAAKYGDEMADDIVRLLDHLKIEKAHLVGYSMGGMITFKVMTEHPERVISALPCGYGWGPPSETDDQMLERLAVALEEDGSIRPLMEFLAGENGTLIERQLQQTDQMLRLMNDTKALAAVVRGFTQLRPDDDKLKANTVPALAIVGTNDPLHLGALHMAEHTPHLEVKLIDGGDHMGTFGDQAFFEHVREFLRTHTKDAVK